MQAGSYKYYSSQLIFSDDYLANVQIKSAQIKSVLDYSVEIQALQPHQKISIGGSGEQKHF